MSIYEFKPEICEKVLEDRTEEILETLLTNKVQNHGYVRLQSNTEDVKTKRQDIRGCLWEQYNVSEKMNQLKELVASQKVYDYITSDSGKDDQNYHAGMNLLKQKEELKTEITKIRNESNLLQHDIDKMTSLIKNHEEKLQSKIRIITDSS